MVCVFAWFYLYQFLSSSLVSVQALCSYTIPKENKGHKPPATISNKPADVNLDPQLLGISDTPDNQAALSGGLRLFPPPLFSRQAVPQGYKSVFISCPETF
jgi:general transcription factor 3C polypeptide 5 (transcription factor C subunit 1)